MHFRILHKIPNYHKGSRNNQFQIDNSKETTRKKRYHH